MSKELHLVFDKTKYKEFCNQLSFETKKRNSDELKVITIFFIFSLLSLALSTIYSYYDPSWIFIPFILLLISYKIFNIILEKRNKIKKISITNKKLISEAINRYSKIKTAKYKFNQLEFGYYEDGNLIDKLSWNEVLTYLITDECVYLSKNEEFDENSFWIPKNMTDEKSFKLFTFQLEETIKKKKLKSK